MKLVKLNHLCVGAALTFSGAGFAAHYVDIITPDGTFDVGSSFNMIGQWSCPAGEKGIVTVCADTATWNCAYAGIYGYSGTFEASCSCAPAASTSKLYADLLCGPENADPSTWTNRKHTEVLDVRCAAS